MHRLPILLLWLSAMIGMAPTLSSQICDAAHFGPATQDPIAVPTGTHLVRDGCTLDFGDRHLIIEGTLQVQTVYIKAGRITVQQSGRIDGANAGKTDIEITRSATHNGDLLVAGKIRQNDSSIGGDVIIVAGGAVSITGSGQIEAKGILAGDADGGTVKITAESDILVDGAGTSINSSSHGVDSTGGETELVSNSGVITVLQDIDASGRAFDGGFIDLTAPNGFIQVHAFLDCHATLDGFGGAVFFTAGGDIDVTGNISCNGGTGTQAYGGGDGGDVDMTSGGSIRISSNIDVEGGILASGGFFDASCTGDFVQTQGHISVHDTAADGLGGEIDIFVGGETILGGELDARGDSADFNFAGIINCVSERDIRLSGLIRADGHTGGQVNLTSNTGDIVVDGDLSARGLGGGKGGTVRLQPFGALDLTEGSVLADGDGNPGIGGTVEGIAGFDIHANANTRVSANGNNNGGGTTAGTIRLEGCRVNFPAQSRIWARSNGNGGRITIIASDVLTLNGEVRADSGSGVIDLTTRIDAPFSPVLTGASFTPAPSVMHDPTLAPCLARKTTTLTTKQQVSIGLGERATVDIQTVPNAPVIVLAGFAKSYASLGRLGYTQIDPATATILADFGYYGPKTPNFRTDAVGRWFFASKPLTSPGLIGRIAYVEAFIVDRNAENGEFHQPPLGLIQFTS